MGEKAVSHETYLKEQLNTKKMEIEQLNIKHRIDLEVYKTKRDSLEAQIFSIEKQLNRNL